MERKPINAVLGGALERKLRVPLELSVENRKVCVGGVVMGGWDRVAFQAEGKRAAQGSMALWGTVVFRIC